MAALEGGVEALAVASGAAAITYTIENLAQAGDHIVAAKNIYGGSLIAAFTSSILNGSTNVASMPYCGSVCSSKLKEPP